MTPTSLGIGDLSDHDGPAFVPPSFERWLGRLQMARTLASMGGFLFTWLAAFNSGLGWEQATFRGVVAAVAFHFLAWGLGLFLFGELYDAEVQRARQTLIEHERDRARRLEEYYVERLRSRGFLDAEGNLTAAGIESGITPPMSAGPTPVAPGVGAPPHAGAAGAAMPGSTARRAA